MKPALATRHSGKNANRLRPSRAEKTLDEISHDEEYIMKAFARGVQRALQQHKQAGNTVVIWEDGQAKEIPPDQIPDTLD